MLGSAANVGLVIVVLGLLVLGYYLGWKITKLNADVEVRDEYIKRQTAVLASFLRAMKRGEDLEKFVDKVSAATTADEFNQLYQEALSGTKPPNP
jgi:hypothetical protein